MIDYCKPRGPSANMEGPEVAFFFFFFLRVGGGVRTKAPLSRDPIGKGDNPCGHVKFCMLTTACSSLWAFLYLTPISVTVYIYIPSQSTHDLLTCICPEILTLNSLMQKAFPFVQTVASSKKQQVGTTQAPVL